MQKLHPGQCGSMPQMSIEDVIRMLGQGSNAAGIPSGDTPVHVGLVEAQTLLKKGKDRRLHMAKSLQSSTIVMIA